MKLSPYCFGLLAVGLIVYAAWPPHGGSLKNSPKLPVDQSAQAPPASSKPGSTSALPASPPPISITPETDPVARYLKEREERRFGQEDKRRDIQRSIDGEAARLGNNTDTVRRLLEMARVPSAAQQQEYAYRAQQRKEDLAKGVRVEMWRRQDELERLSAYLRNGMSLQEVKQLLGQPSNALAHVPKRGVLELVPVPLDQVEQFQGALTLVYSPGTNRNSAGYTDVFHSLHADIGADKTLVGFSYRYFGPF